LICIDAALAMLSSNATQPPMESFKVENHLAAAG
jgi:hypothetical protein